LVLPIVFLGVYLTFPKVVVLILKHATSLRLSTVPQLALIQADLDYQKADVDQQIQQYVATSQTHSGDLDRDFIIAIENGLYIFVFVYII